MPSKPDITRKVSIGPRITLAVLDRILLIIRQMNARDYILKSSKRESRKQILVFEYAGN